MQFLPPHGLPVTKDYDWAKKEGLLTRPDLGRLSHEDGNHNTSCEAHMDSDEIRGWCNARGAATTEPRYLAYKLHQQIRCPRRCAAPSRRKRFIRF